MRVNGLREDFMEFEDITRKIVESDVKTTI